MTLKTDTLRKTPKQKLCKVRIVEPYSITHQFKPEVDFYGRSLLELMSIKFPFHPIDEWRQRIENGRVYVNDEPVSPTFLLSRDDLIYHHNPAVKEPSVPDDVRIVEETEDYLAVFKPAPMPMHPGGRYNKNTLKYILEERGFSDLRITHRLDAVTSGVVLFAKNKVFAKQVMLAFSGGNVEKEYVAVVSGEPKEDCFEIQSRIRRKQGFVFESGADFETGFKAHTKFEVVERWGDSSLVKCKPVTGRTHQIRLHLREAGNPIIDDPIYGPNGDTSSKRKQNVGISLASVKLKIPDLNIKLEILDYEF